MVPTEDSWRHLAFVTLTQVYTNTFVDDLIRLSQIKQEFAMISLAFKF